MAGDTRTIAEANPVGLEPSTFARLVASISETLADVPGLSIESGYKGISWTTPEPPGADE